MELLMKHCRRKVSKGIVSYKYNKGLWEVEGRLENESQVRREAEHYFVQYFDDGEYDGTWVEKMWKRANPSHSS